MLLLFVLVWLCQPCCGVLKGGTRNSLTALKIQWSDLSREPRGLSSFWAAAALRKKHTFSYEGNNGQETWAQTYKDCGGRRQSPINIETSRLKKKKMKEPLKWSNYSKTPESMILENSLHSIHANGVWESSSDIPYISKGPLDNRYYFSQLHFHWGRTDDTGSEHTVNSKSYPLEMHVVHDRRLEDPTNLSQEANSRSLVVVGYMFEIVEDDNPDLEPILEGLPEIEGSEKKKTSIEPFALENLVETFQGDYVTYQGSLTTPPCTEGVIWIIRSRALGISESQVAIYLNDRFGIYECFKPCEKAERFQFGYRKYNGPSVWKEHYESALGQRQSPINILQSEVTKRHGSRLQWECYSAVPESMIMYNDGYSIALDGNWKKEKPKLTGAPLNDEVYIFNRLYFHWGPTDSEGSEHTLDYERFPLELHMIFLKEGFNTLMDAHYEKSSNGIVIVAFLFEITPVDNPGFLSTVTDNLHKVRTPKSGCCVEPFALNDIYPPFEFNYYKYDGSITQPPCSEIVTYIIQTETIAVSKRQMSRFRKLLAFDGKPMVNNSRPVQKLNRRTVYYFTR